MNLIFDQLLLVFQIFSVCVILQAPWLFYFSLTYLSSFVVDETEMLMPLLNEIFDDIVEYKKPSRIYMFFRLRNHLSLTANSTADKSMVFKWGRIEG